MNNKVLPIKYVDEAINADRLLGRAMGLMAEISKRAECPFTLENEILNESNMLLAGFLRIAKVVTDEEQRVLKALIDEYKRMSKSEIGRASDNHLRRELELGIGWINEARKVLEGGGSMYDLLIFTSPTYQETEDNKVEAKGSHYELPESHMRCFKEDGKEGLKDKSGKVVIPAEYDVIDCSGWAGRGWHLEKDGKWGAVNERAEWMFPVEYDKITARYKGGHVLVKNGKAGFCNPDGVMTVDFKYDEIDDVNYSSSDGLKVRLNGKWGYIDIMDNLIVPIKYDDLYSYNNEFVKLRKGEKYGAINIKENITIPFVYDYMSISRDEVIVKKESKWGVINTVGEIVLPHDYEYVNIDSGSLYRVKKNGLFGIIDKKGRIVFPFKYKTLGSFNDDGIAYAQDQEDNYGYIDRQDNVIIPFHFKSAREFYRGYAEVSMGMDECGLIDKNGTIVVPCKYRRVSIHGDDIVEVVTDDRTGRRYLKGIYDLKTGNILPCRYEEIRPQGRDENGNLVCACRNRRYSEPVMVKVEPQNHKDSSPNKEIYYVKLNTFYNGEYVVIDINQNNDADGVWIEAECINKILYLPKTFGNRKIVGLGDHCCRLGNTNERDIRGLIIPEGYKYIGEEAFLGHPTLELVSFPNGLHKIGRCAFMKCTKLKHVLMGEFAGVNGILLAPWYINPFAIIGRYCFDEADISLTIYISRNSRCERYIKCRFANVNFQTGKFEIREENEEAIMSDYIPKEETK